MTNPAMQHLSRSEKRQLLSLEAKRRASGKWPKWETIEIPYGTIGNGWSVGFTQVRRNWVFSVLCRHLVGEDGETYAHLAISSLSGIRPTWPEAQRIKSEICGDEATAIEVYPPESEVVDEADMYHLWVLPNRLPFSLRRSE